jgi:hypothetical protein
VWHSFPDVKHGEVSILNAVMILFRNKGLDVLLSANGNFANVKALACQGEAFDFSNLRNDGRGEALAKNRGLININSEVANLESCNKI